jgi:hypothetical protein
VLNHQAIRPLFNFYRISAGKIMEDLSCWICGNKATTREHIIKQSDVRRLFGSGPYEKGKRLVRTDEARDKRIIQSKDSVYIKYQPSLCQYCNSTRSQPWDQAYDKFMEFIQLNSQRIKQTKKFRLSNITPGNEIKFASNLYSYFIKAFGCQIVEHGQYPPTDLSEYLLGKKSSCDLVITFAVDSGLPADLPSPMVQIHDLEGKMKLETGRRTNYTWAFSVEWLTIIFWCQKKPSPTSGRVWKGTSDQIVIGSF